VLSGDPIPITSAAATNGNAPERVSSLTEIEAPPHAIYRLHLKTAGDRAKVIDYCLRENVIGLGWGMNWSEGEHPAPRVFDEWREYAEEIWPRQRTWRFWPVIWMHDAEPGSLVWTRDLGGIYYLGQIVGPWRYADAPLNRELDLTSLRDVRFHRIGSEGDVPGAVVRSYSNRGRAFQHVSDAGAAWYSAYLFAEKAGRALPEWRPSLMQVIDSLLGPFDVQDLIAAYLQVERGYIALPARQVDSTLAYEYVLRHPSNGHLAVAQVKTGAQAVETDTLPTADEDLRCFIFSPRHNYPAVLPPNVVPIDVEDIAAFVRNNPNPLPPVVQRWAVRAAD